LENNLLYNNKGGCYKNADSETDIYVDPLFVDQKNHDYRLIPNVQREQKTALREFIKCGIQKIRTIITWCQLPATEVTGMDISDNPDQIIRVGS